MLDLRRLQTFREVVRLESFSAAADSLDYTQSSVSQQIGVLERELGAPLIDRTSRPVAPTPAGRAVLGQVGELLDRAEAIEADVASLARGEAGVLRMGGFFTAWATFMPGAVAAFAAERPGGRLELEQLEPAPARAALEAGTLDLAVVFVVPGQDAEPEGRHLFHDPHALALPAGHRLAGRKRVRLRDLAREKWVVPPRGFPYTEALMEMCRGEGFEPDVAYETADVAMAQPLVAAGLAVALLPRLALVPQHAGVAVVPLTGEPPARQVWALQAPHAGPAAEAMVKALAAAGASRPTP